MNFPAWVREQRESRRLRPGEAARQIGVSRATYSRWEHGHYGPSVDGARRLSAWTGTALTTILNLTPSDTPSANPGVANDP